MGPVGAGQRNKKYTKEEKGKSKLPPRKPQAWKPPTDIRPRPAVRVTTRARRVLAYHMKEVANADAAIWDVLQACEAPESCDIGDSIAIRNLEFKEHVFEEPEWNATIPRPRAGASEGGPESAAVEVKGSLAADGSTWNVGRAGWAVLILNRFLSEYSFHTCQTSSWTQGDVVVEYVHVVTAKEMVVCELRGFVSHLHFPASDVRMALGPNIRAMSSEGAHRYLWAKRRQCISAKRGPQGVWAGRGSAVPTPTTVVGENAPSRGVFGQRTVEEYREPSEEDEAPNGTQDSTDRVA